MKEERPRLASSWINNLLPRVAHKLGYSVTRIDPPNLTLYGQYPKQSLADRRFYNVGAGQFRHPYWTNIDHGTDYYDAYLKKFPFIDHDLMALKPFQIESESAEIVYTSHTIEHISNEAAQKVFDEAHRILRPGGAFRLTTPDADLGFAAYKARDRLFWYWTQFRGAEIEQLFLHHYASQVTAIDPDTTPKKKYSSREIAEVLASRSLPEALDFFTSQCAFNPQCAGNHINWWTMDKAAQFLRRAGFTTIYRSAYTQSRFAPLRELPWFDSTHPAISLYVEAVK